MKYIMKFNGESYPISEEEIPKIMQAMESRAIVILRCGVFHGMFIRGIVRDIHADKGWNYGYKPQGGDGLARKDFVTELPERIGANYELLPRSEAKSLKPYNDE